MDLGLGFAIRIHALIPDSVLSFVLLESEPLPQSQVFCISCNRFSFRITLY